MANPPQVTLQQPATRATSPSAPAAAQQPQRASAAAGAQGARSEVVIDVRDLRKVYGDGTEAVKGISFQVRRGEIFGFLGPNGAGKTTSMRILGTLQDASHGTATILGLDVKKDAAKVKRRIGFAMQEVGMDDLATARELLVLHGKLYGMSGREAKARAEQLLVTFDLAEHGDRRVTRFSGGMQRRLDLAVSLIHTPDVLFLDEPSTGLDPKSRATLWAILRKLRAEQGMTVMLSTHYMDEADALCDRIAVVNKGVIAAIDTPTNLKRSVGSDTVRVSLASPLTRLQREGLERTFGPHNVLQRDGAIDIRVKDGSKALVPALKVVTDLGIAITETRVVTPTLEDAFLKFTGARFDATGGKADDEQALEGKGPKPKGRAARKAAKAAAPSSPPAPKEVRA